MRPPIYGEKLAILFFQRRKRRTHMAATIGPACVAEWIKAREPWQGTCSDLKLRGRERRHSGHGRKSLSPTPCPRRSREDGQGSRISQSFVSDKDPGHPSHLSAVQNYIEPRKQSRGFILSTRDHPGVVGYLGNVIVAGGAIGRERLNTVEAYDASTGEWSRMKDLKGRT